MEIPHITEKFIKDYIPYSSMPYKDPEKKKEYNKEYYQKNKEKIKQRAKEWGIQNRERRLEIKRKWYRNNKEKHLEGIRKHRKDYPEKVREQARKTVAKVKREAAAKIGTNCALCGTNEQLCFHQKYYEKHKKGVGGWYEARKRPEDFIRLCFKCHVMVHILYEKFNIRFEELKTWIKKK